MSVPSVTLTLLASLLIIGCASTEQRPTCSRTPTGSSLLPLIRTEHKVRVT